MAVEMEAAALYAFAEVRIYRANRQGINLVVVKYCLNVAYKLPLMRYAVELPELTGCVDWC
jgi:hypothetical protein